MYVSSFWSKAYKPDTNHLLFETEKQALLYDMLYAVPLEALDRKVVCPPPLLTPTFVRPVLGVVRRCIAGGRQPPPTSNGPD